MNKRRLFFLCRCCFFYNIHWPCFQSHSLMECPLMFILFLTPQKQPISTVQLDVFLMKRYKNQLVSAADWKETGKWPDAMLAAKSRAQRWHFRDAVNAACLSCCSSVPAWLDCSWYLSPWSSTSLSSAVASASILWFGILLCLQWALLCRLPASQDVPNTQTVTLSSLFLKV